MAFWRRRVEGDRNGSNFELLELPATRKSLRIYGSDDSEEVARALSRCRREDQTDREKSGSDPISKLGPIDVHSEDEEAEEEHGHHAKSQWSGKPTPPRTEVTESEAVKRRASPDPDYASPPMEGCGMGGKPFDFDAWLDSIRAK